MSDRGLRAPILTDLSVGIDPWVRERAAEGGLKGGGDGSRSQPLPACIRSLEVGREVRDHVSGEIFQRVREKIED